MVSFYQLRYFLHYWTSLCFLSSFHVSAKEYCRKGENGVSTSCINCNSLEPPQLPEYCPKSHSCVPVTTTELPSTSVTTDQPTTESTGTTGVTLTYTTAGVGTQSTPQSTPEITSPDGHNATHTPGGISGTPLTTPKTTTGVQNTTPINTTQGERTTATDQPINTTASSQPDSHADVTTPSQNETVNGTDDGGEGTTVSTVSPAVPEAVALPTWAIIIIVLGSTLLFIVVVGSICLLLKKKHDTCKVHCESDVDASSPTLSALPPPHDPPGSQGALVPLAQGISSASPVTGDEQGPQLPHVPDSTDTTQDASRDRTLSTGSHAGDTKALIPHSAETSQQPKKKKKKKKKDKTDAQSSLELGPVRAPSNHEHVA